MPINFTVDWFHNLFRFFKYYLLDGVPNTPSQKNCYKYKIGVFEGLGVKHILYDLKYSVLLSLIREIFHDSYVSEYCEKYAKPEDAGAVPEEKSSDEEPSDEEYASSDDAMVGEADP